MGNGARIEEEAAHCSWRVLSWALLATLPAAWAQDAAAPAEPPAPPAKPVELHLDDSRRLLSQAQWDTLLEAQSADEDQDEELPELGGADVEVEGERTAPQVPDGIAGLFWALRHPTQAWRLFVPAQ